MAIVVMELHNSWKWVFLTKLHKLHCIYGELQRVYAICPLAPTSYKYSELQVSDALQKLSCKADCKTPLFLIMFVQSIVLGSCVGRGGIK